MSDPQRRHDVGIKKPQKQTLTYDIIKKLPKAELHLHLDGSLRVETIIELAKEQGVKLPSFDPSVLKSMVVVSSESTSLVEYLKSFDITLSVLQKTYALTRAMFEVCEDCHKDGIRYVEVRFSPILHIQEGMALSSAMEAICEGGRLAESRLGIVARIIVCGMRQMDPSITAKLAEICWRYREKGVVAFDLAGPEEGFSSKMHKEAFDIVRSKHISCTLHSGEAAGFHSIIDSIRYCGATRLGHGARLTESPTLMLYVRDQNITIESCVTSNIQTGAVSSLSAHPLPIFFHAGINVVPCTDNRTVSNVTLSNEYDLITRSFGFSVEEIVKLIDNGFRSTFAENSFRNRLRVESLQQCMTILHSEGFDMSGMDIPYYRKLGLEISPEIPRLPYWGGHDNPKITKEIIRLLPKSDLHCRLDGSIRIETLWKEFQLEKSNIKLKLPEFKEMKDLRNFMENCGKDSDHLSLCRQLMSTLQQTRLQVERSFVDIIEQAVDHGVTYIEMMFRPDSHISEDLPTREDVVQLLVNLKNQFQLEKKIRIGLVVYSHVERDDPIVFLRNAEISLKFRPDGICGYGMLGGEIPVESLKYFSATFDFIRQHHINLVMSSWNSQHHVVSCLELGAHRISGAFSVHNDPLLVSTLASRNVPIELGMTPMMEELFSQVRTFAGNPIRLYVDNDLVVNICSFHQCLAPMDRVEALFQVHHVTFNLKFQLEIQLEFPNS
eukprot:TRINITY_DN2753_c0_g1_i1.p1 TRINITY_DN2753_c0_g1~~TRINITY_DN2753_c0_g1_i1.p1  ORF type:complete len:722 (+),score=251.54 TRINITY_DN2753_c0_g1_i1:20-2185(+)